MFTGIIEEMGRIKKIESGNTKAALTIQGEKIFSDLSIGDSVSVNGVCLTAARIENHCFVADVMPETFRRTALLGLQIGSLVNLERALPAYGRFGGHIVTGHIDGTGTIEEIKKESNAILYRINTKKALADLMVEKGSVAIDGISLTIVEVKGTSFLVSVIPHTAKHTILGGKGRKDLVNIENDILGKYIARAESFRDEQKNKDRILAEFMMG